ncbi:MAG: efflux RND transporter permease subunit [Dehalococcoidia bacterium]|nr:MAG: efflux RND transporter permease subunit [Dehalococcoidia bacterium]
MWFLTRLSLKNRAVTIFLAALLAGASIWATLQLKLEMIPDIELPYIMVIAAYPNASPDEVVADVTMPIEDVIWEQWEGKGLKHTYATSADGISVVFAEFNFGTDMEEVKEAVEQGVSPGELELPPEVRNVPQMDPRIKENPQIQRLDPSMMPLVIFSLRGDLPSEQLGAIAQTQIVPELRNIEDIADVQTEGGEKEQILITPDPEKMNQFGISMYQIAGLLSLVPEYSSLGDIKNVAMGVDAVVLGDVAGVVQGPAPRTRIARTNGLPSVGIAVMKEKEANTVEVANAVVARAEEIEEELQAEYGDEVKLELTPVFDQSEFIEESIGQLTNMALIGAGLAIVIVFLFLAAFRASLVTAMSIPFSIVIGFLGMYFSGITINLLTLSAMAIAVGRLIDNSIVVAEVVYRRLQQGEGFREAAINGSKEIAAPITASTLATVAIFIPLMFVGGIVGELFIPFALTIIFALIASLLVALMVVPAFSNWFVSKKEKKDKVRVEPGETWYQKLYIPSLKWALGHRAITLVVAGVLFFGSLALIPMIGTSFIPGMGEKMLIVEIELPSGTDSGTTSEVAASIEDLLADNDEVEIYHTTVGTSTTSVHAAMAAAMGGGDNTAEITVLLDPGANEPKEQEDLELGIEGLMIEGLMLGDYVTVLSGDEAQGSQMGFGSGLDISVTGESSAEVNLAAELLYERLEEIEDISHLESQLTRVVRKLYIEPDPDRIMTSGLPAEQLGQVEQEFFLLMRGNTVSGVVANIDGESYEIFIKEIAKDLGDVTEAKALRFGWPESVSLGDIADVALLERPTHIDRIDKKLSASITGEITAKNVGAVNRLVEDEIGAVEDEIDALGIEGVEIRPGGVMEEMAESFSKMGIAIMIAIVIALLILVVTMRSILNPLIIMVSLPLASIGALLALLIAGYTLGISGMMGVLMLVGIVLTNAIVLIALVEQLRKEGVSTYDALVEGGRTRLRPILMTALTTMFAMLPLALGLGGGTLIAGELAVVVIGGLFSSTLLTLLVIPVIYSLVDGLRRRFARAS